MNYKIETKMGYWAVILRRGEYSDKTEVYLYFKANNEDETWFFLQKYLKELNEFDGWEYKVHQSKFIYGEKTLTLGNDNYGRFDWDVKIKPLDVIYFAE